MGRFDNNEPHSYKGGRKGLQVNSVEDDKPTWVKSEERGAEMLKDGKLTIASGRLPFDKGDFKNHQFLGECKSTDKESLILSVEWLRKISGEAVSQNKTPLLFLTLSRMGVNQDWVVCEKAFFQERLEETESIFEELKRLREENLKLRKVSQK